MAKRLSNKNQALLALGAAAAIGVFLYTRKKSKVAGVGKLSDAQKRRIIEAQKAYDLYTYKYPYRFRAMPGYEDLGVLDINKRDYEDFAQYVTDKRKRREKAFFNDASVITRRNVYNSLKRMYPNEEPTVEKVNEMYNILMKHPGV